MRPCLFILSHPSYARPPLVTASLCRNLAGTDPMTMAEEGDAEAMRHGEMAASPPSPSASAWGGASTSAEPPAEHVRVSGWMYKSPSRLGPPAGRLSTVANASVGGQASAEADTDSSASGGKRSRRPSAAATLMSMMPTQSETVPIPQDKRFFVLDGQELRSRTLHRTRDIARCMLLPPCHSCFSTHSMQTT